MMSRFAFVLAILALAGLAGWQATAQQGSVYADAGEAGEALRLAGQALAQTPRPGRKAGTIRPRR